MSDALCGPSNALQNFQKHASADRTLQQDRRTSLQSPFQGFRSHDPRDGVLDPEFAAFEASLGDAALPNLQHPANLQEQVQRHGNNQMNVGWATDFQNLHISAPPPSQLQRPSIGLAPEGWQSEFLALQEQASQNQVQIRQPAVNRGFQPALTPSYPIYNASVNIHQAPPGMHSAHFVAANQFDESAFEAAFEQARADLDLQRAGAEHDAHQDAQHEAEQDLHETNPVGLTETAHNTIRIGSDTIPQTVPQDAEPRGSDADALAQTAGQLLDSVRHDQSEKFQQSNFLALMRRIRDREIEVQGDEFREVSNNP